MDTLCERGLGRFNQRVLARREAYTRRPHPVRVARTSFPRKSGCRLGFPPFLASPVGGKQKFPLMPYRFPAMNRCMALGMGESKTAFSLLDGWTKDNDLACRAIRLRTQPIC
ncbi:hypothetical protein Q31b_01680 [Novipirellula aureliae]|uniref:Uncharacterized protein n=1 Tax=Novipirellula aureliae TaxID=2527966 RepID=A0A5C6EAJ6_9BACT|nr:hypothetical protein Q31b_01680 [Novipirellula aureliae]